MKKNSQRMPKPKGEAVFHSTKVDLLKWANRLPEILKDCRFTKLDVLSICDRVRPVIGDALRIKHMNVAYDLWESKPFVAIRRRHIRFLKRFNKLKLSKKESEAQRRIGKALWRDWEELLAKQSHLDYNQKGWLEAQFSFHSSESPK